MTDENSPRSIFAAAALALLVAAGLFLFMTPPNKSPELADDYKPAAMDKRIAGLEKQVVSEFTAANEINHAFREQIDATDSKVAALEKQLADLKAKCTRCHQ